jgi:hypothetical protein
MVATGVLDLLVRNMQHDNLDMLENIVGTLGNIACFNGREDSLIASGAVPSLVRVLQGEREGRDGVVERTAGAIGNIATSNQSRQVLLQAGAMAPLVTLLASPNEAVRENAAWAVSNLVTSPSPPQALPQLFECRAHPLLIATLSSKSSAAQTYALQTLCYMTHSWVYREDVVEAGAVPLAVDLLCSSSVATRQAAAALVSNLSWSASTRQLLMQCQCQSMPDSPHEERGSHRDDVLMHLLAIVRDGLTEAASATRQPTTHSSSAKRMVLHLRAAQHATQAISNIAMTDIFRERIVLVGGLEVLASSLQIGSGASVRVGWDVVCALQTAAVNALSNISRSFHLMRSVLDSGAVEGMLGILRHLTGRCLPIDSDSSGDNDSAYCDLPSCCNCLALVDVCAEALGHLAFTDDMRSALWHMGALSLLLNVASSAATILFSSKVRSVPSSSEPCLHHRLATPNAIQIGSEEEISVTLQDRAAPHLLIMTSRVLETSLLALAHLSFLPACRVDLYHLHSCFHADTITDSKATRGVSSRTVSMLVDVLRFDGIKSPSSPPSAGATVSYPPSSVIASTSTKCRESCCLLLGNLGTLPSLQDDVEACEQIRTALQHIVSRHSISAGSGNLYSLAAVCGQFMIGSGGGGGCRVGEEEGRSNADYDAACAALALYDAVAPPSSSSSFPQEQRPAAAGVETWSVWLWQKLGYVFPLVTVSTS